MRGQRDDTIMNDAEQGNMVPTHRFDQHNTGPLSEEAQEPFVQEQLRLAGLIRDISLALIQSTGLQEMAQQCTEALVQHFAAAFARIWTLNAETQVLELQASAGMYTHLDGPHSRVPVGTLKIGLIASECLPHLTNAVVGDSRVSDQAWAMREGMVAFAGYPLISSERLVGVMALFARHPLSPSVLDAMASVANTIAVGIDRKQGEQERNHLLLVEQQARQAAEAALSVRTSFLSSVSHDLKTPLASIKANVQLVQRRLKRERGDAGSWFIERLVSVEKATTKMTGMIDDLLNLARQQSGQQQDEVFRPLDLMTIIRQVVAEQQATTKRHRLLLTSECKHLPICGSAARVDRAVTNLLGNAIKYSPKGGEITIVVTQEEQEARFWAVVHITDPGIGIPAAALSHIFEPFYRVSDVASRIQGTGVGLASVAQVVEQHRGTITVTSREGEGSSFTMRLPLVTETAMPEV